MNKLSFFLLLCIALLATGCPQNAPKLDLKNGNYKNLLVGQLKENVFMKEWVEYKCANDGYYNLEIGTNKTSFNTFSCGTSDVKKPESAARIRNEVVDIRVVVMKEKS
jgi:hypothetical protein